MSHLGSGYDINQTFIIEPTSDSNPTLTGCTGVYTNHLYSCSGNTEIILSENNVSFIGNIDAYNISGSSFYGDGSYLTGVIKFDVFVTGGTYSNGTAIFTNNTGGTFQVSGFSTGGTGGFDVFVTGGTYSNGTATFTNNTGGTFSVTGLYTGGTDVFVTGGTYSNGTTIFTNNTGGTFSISGFSTGGTGGFDVFVTGGTYSNGTAIFTNNTGGTFNVTGFSTGGTGGFDVFVTGGTYSNGTAIFTNNTGGTFNVTGLYTGATDVFVTGGTYSNGTATFRNNTGGTFSVSGFTTGDTSNFVYRTGDTMTGGLFSPSFTGDSFYLSTGATETSSTGKFKWNDVNGTADIGLKGGSITLSLGQQSLIRVVNKTSSNLLKSDYKVVRIRYVSEGGAQGQRLAVVLAQGNNSFNSGDVLGVVGENIDNNQEGFIIVYGEIFNLNTSGSLQGETWNDGDVLYLSPTTAGFVTNIRPSAPNHSVIIGYVEYAHSSNGKIFITVKNGYELGDLHNVAISGLTNNDILKYNSTNQVWENSSILSTKANLSGSTFTGQITTPSISATTYYNLPIDVFVTGGTYSNGTTTFINNTGGTFNITGYLTGGTGGFDVFVTGGTYSNGTAIFTNNTGGTFSISGLYTGATDVFVTGGTYSNGTAIFTNNTGGTFNVTGFSTGGTSNFDVFVTGGTYSNGTAIFTNNTGGTFNVTGFKTNDIFVTGGTYSRGSLTFTNNTGGTFSITGLYTGATDVFVTGGTYSNGTATFRNNTGGTFTVTGLYTGGTDVFVTGGTYSNGTAIFTNNTGGTFSISGFSTGGTGGFDVFVTGGTYSNGTAIFTNNTGGTFNVTGFKTNDIFVTGGTYSNGTAIFTNNTGGTFNVSGFSTGGTGGFDVFVTGGTYSNGTTTFTNNTGGTFSVSGYLTGATFNGGTVTGATTFTNGLSANTLSATTLYSGGTNLTSIFALASNAHKYVTKDYTDSAVTGTLSETILYSKLIPANTFAVGDILHITARWRKTGTAGTHTPKIRIHTSAAVAGNTIYGSTALGATNLSTLVLKLGVIKSATNTEFGPLANGNDESANSLAGACVSYNIDWTVDQYIIFTGTLGNTGDTETYSFSKIEVI